MRSGAHQKGGLGDDRYTLKHQFKNLPDFLSLPNFEGWGADLNRLGGRMLEPADLKLAALLSDEIHLSGHLAPADTSDRMDFRA